MGAIKIAKQDLRKSPKMDLIAKIKLAAKDQDLAMIAVVNLNKVMDSMMMAQIRMKTRKMMNNMTQALVTYQVHLKCSKSLFRL